MLNVIVQEELYDRDFVANQVYGWQPFVERVNAYPLERVEAITWVPGEDPRCSPALRAHQTGGHSMGGGHRQQINCADNDRLLMFLMGLTGNIDVSRGQMLFHASRIRNVGHFGATACSRTPAREAPGRERSGWREILRSSTPSASGMRFSKRSLSVKMLFFISSNPS